MKYSYEDIKQIRIFYAWLRKNTSKPLTAKREKELRLQAKHQTAKEIEEEIKRVNEAILRAAVRNETREYPSEKEEGFLVEKDYPYDEYAKAHKKFLEEKVYESHKPGKMLPQTVPKYEKEFTGEKSTRKPSVFIDQTTPSTLEKVDYKVGSQGYPKDVKAFEKEVTKQHPTTRQEYRDIQREEGLEDSKPDKFIYEYLNALRRRFNLVGGKFSDATERWFKEHPPDVVALALYKDSVTRRRKEAGRKMGLKSKGGGRPKKFHTLKERKEAKKVSQKKRAKEMRRND